MGVTAGKTAEYINGSELQSLLNKQLLSPRPQLSLTLPMKGKRKKEREGSVGFKSGVIPDWGKVLGDFLKATTKNSNLKLNS